MATLKFTDTHNMVVFLSKPTESDEFEQIVDFLNAHPIRYALTINPTIYISCIEQFWSSVKSKTINGEAQLHALVDDKKIIITESSVGRDLQLADEKDEVVHKELGDSLVRAATTTSSLEAEQDSGNINKTQSKETPNESSSQKTNSDGGPRCQETVGDTIAQTRLKLDELMALSTNLQNMVLDLEQTKTTQHNEISSLKRMVKKLEKKNRIDAIDADDEIILVSVHDMNVSAGEEVVKEVVEVINNVKLIIDAAQDKGKGILIEPVKPMKKKDQIRLDEETTFNLQAKFDEEERLVREKAKKEKETNIALIETWDDIQAKIDADHQMAKRIQAQEQEELAEKKRNKPPTKAQQRKIICTYLKNMEGYKLNDLKLKEFDSIQEMFDKAFKRVNTVEDFRTELVESKEKRAETEMEIIPDEEEVTIDVITLAVKSPSIVGWKIHKEGRKSYYQIMRADGKSQMYMIFSHILKSFDRENLVDLYKLVKAKYESTSPVEDLDLLL
ncbi:hypothetical protein Tco_1029032 [Tanacetum coccineum]|uniref:Xylulose kinase-1 n=1 Tax=Tanacetum coccineum TaxID=301880 RepID=A0ABQ5G2K7_9ASTR